MKVVDTGLFVLKSLDSSEFVEASESFPQPYLDFPDLDPTVSAPFELPAILVPPEVIELDGLATDAGEDAQVKKEDWPQYFFHLFDNDVRVIFLGTNNVLTRITSDHPRPCHARWIPSSVPDPRYD